MTEKEFGDFIIKLLDRGRRCRCSCKICHENIKEAIIKKHKKIIKELLKEKIK